MRSLSIGKVPVGSPAAGLSSTAVAMSARTSPVGLETDRYLTVRRVLDLTSWSRSTLHRAVRAQRFPSPRRLGPNRVGFLQSEVIEWMRTREPS